MICTVRILYVGRCDCLQRRIYANLISVLAVLAHQGLLVETVSKWNMRRVMIRWRVCWKNAIAAESLLWDTTWYSTHSTLHILYIAEVWGSLIDRYALWVSRATGSLEPCIQTCSQIFHVSFNSDDPLNLHLPLQLPRLRILRLEVEGDVANVKCDATPAGFAVLHFIIFYLATRLA